ncbi:M16 family metallopeptidase [Treponema brennaborense]|uniref:Processing peptidase n=1 Tax=Treponema brennaborense (strain DSM 12168 / CIP 105900 / DD5/3) TaxID=906968 RepID=F4LJD7_TREBD|nr:pitrilysin family protein [Treponema brennaborense]AEE17382.1 processing peptidase [Treponema brennaborense DSM 12168]
MSVSTQILTNKTVLVTEPVAEVQTAAIGFWFRAGSRYERPGERGVTHFAEHLLFKGTDTRRAFDIASSFDRIGGYINAFTERENVCVYCVVPAVHVQTALDILCDMTERSVFDPEEVERERAVIESEIISSQDDAEEAALDAASEAVWPNHPVSASISGSVKDVEKLTRDQVYRWYRERFASGALTVCLAGNIDAASAARRLETLSVRSEPPADDIGLVVSAPEWKRGVVFQEAPFRQTQFFAQFPLPVPFDERQYYSWAILNALAGDTMSSRLFQKLREESGFCYNVYSFTTFYADAGCWCAYASSAKRYGLRLVKTLFRELRALREQGFTEDEVTAAKEHLCGEEIISSEDMEYRMKRLARNYTYGFPQRSTADVVDCIRSITAEELSAALRILCDFDRAALLVYGPRVTERMKGQLVAASEIVQSDSDR